MNPLDAREAEETYEYPARPYTLPMRPVQTFRVLSESGDNVATDPYPEYSDDELDICFPAAQTTEIDEVGEEAFAEGYFQGCEDVQNYPMAPITPNPYWTPEDLAWAERERLIGEITGLPFTPDAWSDKYLTAEDARVLRQDGI